MATEASQARVIDDEQFRRRLSWTTASRLGVLAVLLGLIGALNAQRGFSPGGFTTQVAVVTLVVAFALAGSYAVALRGNWRLQQVVDVQLVCDQIIWTVVVYLSGGAASGATAFYGLSCLVGAMLTGFRGAFIAASAGTLCMLVLFYVLGEGILGPPPDQPAAAYLLTREQVAYSAVLNVLIIVVVSLLSGNLAERLRKVGGRVVAAEERADQAERLAALGRLAAGLAHEIRNPLGSISGSIQLLRSNPSLSAEDRELCSIINSEAARLDDLVSDMMQLARPRSPVLGTVDAAALAREVVSLASNSGRAGSDVKVVFSGADVARVRADSSQLRQVLWNLVRNAVQASQAGDLVSVEVGVAGGRVTLRVRDKGMGLDEEARRRIFDVFFTTRSQGTGVGLAVVKRICDEHGFGIEVDSEAGEGAIFTVSLGASIDADTPGGSIAGGAGDARSP